MSVFEAMYPFEVATDIWTNGVVQVYVDFEPGIYTVVKGNVAETLRAMPQWKITGSILSGRPTATYVVLDDVLAIIEEEK